MRNWFGLTVKVTVVWLLTVAPIWATQSMKEATDATEMHKFYAYSGSGAGTGSGIYDLAINKSVVTLGPYSPGMDVKYLITVTNEGTIDSWDPEITDYIPYGMSLSPNDNNNWTVIGGGNAINTLPTVMTGSGVSLCIILTIDSDFSGGCITNQVAITDYYDDYEDCDSDPHQGFNDDEDGDGNPIDDDEDIATICVGNIILALSDISLNGVRNGDYNTLTWTVSNEHTLDYYEIYRILPGQTQEMLTSLPNTHDEVYNFIDSDINESAYYKIVGIDFSGSQTESSMIYIEAQSDPIHLSIYPNPTADYVTIQGNQIEKIQVYNPHGQQLGEIIGNQSETYTYHFDVEVSGMYNLVVRHLDGSTTTQRVAVIK